MTTHLLPETWSDEPSHVLDAHCWCQPLAADDYVTHRWPDGRLTCISYTTMNGDD